MTVRISMNCRCRYRRRIVELLRLSSRMGVQLPEVPTESKDSAAPGNAQYQQQLHDPGPKIPLHGGFNALCTDGLSVVNHA